MPKIFDSRHPVGEIKPLNSATAPDGFLVCNGQTIGNSSSGASVAQSYLFDLYAFLWNNYSNTDLAILTSTGGASTRGASAAADWAANKRMPVPNLAGRTLIGAGTYSDSVSGTVTRALGANLGAEKHTLAATESGVPSHTHGVGGTVGGSDGTHTHTDSGHTHQFTIQSAAGGASNPGSGAGGGVAITTTQGFANITSTNSGHGHSFSLTANAPTAAAASSSHNNMQPSHVTNWMIRY